MLPAGQRLRRRDEFTSTIRTGRRVGRGGLVVHLAGPIASAVAVAPARAGFIVPKAVGNAVARNRVRRRLRHLVRTRLDRLPPGTDLVIRVLPQATARTYDELGADLDAAVSTASAGTADRSTGRRRAAR